MDLDGSGDVDELPDPVQRLREAGAVKAGLGKSSTGASISTDWLQVDEALASATVTQKHSG
jgi:hypothetical protein